MFPKSSRKKKMITSKVSISKKGGLFKSPPVILYYLIVVNYACFFGPPIFESIVEVCFSYLKKIEPEIPFILKKYNHLLLKKFQYPYQFQKEMVQLHKDYLSQSNNLFQKFFNTKFEFQKTFQYIGKLRTPKKESSKRKLFSQRFQQLFIYTTSGLKVYLLADKLISSIFIIFRGTDELQNKSSNLSAELQQAELETLSTIRLLLNKPELGLTIGDCGHEYISQIFRLISEATHTIINGVLYLSEHFLGGVNPANLYITGASLGGQCASIFSSMYPRIYSSIQPKYQKLITSRCYCFPLSSPKVFRKKTSIQMEDYISKNQIGWMRYFTIGDLSRYILLESKGWYNPHLKNIETAFCYQPKNGLGQWVIGENEKQKPVSILNVMSSLTTNHQNFFGCLFNSLIHPCHLLSPFFIHQLYVYLSGKSLKKESGITSRFDYPYFDFLIKNLQNSEKKPLISLENIQNFWSSFQQPIMIDNFGDSYRDYNQIYNYLHGFPNSRMIDFEIFRQLNSKVHEHLQVDLNSLYQLLQLTISGLKESPLFKDSFYYLVFKGLENRQQFSIFITFNKKQSQIEFFFQPTMLYNTDFLLGDPSFFKKVILGNHNWRIKINRSQIEIYQNQHLYSKKIDINKLIKQKRKTLIDCNC